MCDLNILNTAEALPDDDHFEDILKRIRVLDDRDADLEDLILRTRNSEGAYFYAFTFFEGRWLDAEPIIMNDPEGAFFYADKKIKGRWRAAEPTILSNPEWAEHYIKLIERTEAEKVLDEVKGIAMTYAASRFIREHGRAPDPEAEDEIEAEIGEWIQEMCNETETQA